MLSVVSNSHRFYTLFFIHILDGFIYKCTHIMLQTILYRSKILFLYITPSHQHIQLFHSASENVLLKKKIAGKYENAYGTIQAVSSSYQFHPSLHNMSYSTHVDTILYAPLLLFQLTYYYNGILPLFIAYLFLVLLSNIP